jgi:uncharacterized membrane-anchored protein
MTRFLSLDAANRCDMRALFAVVLLVDLPQLGHRCLAGDAGHRGQGSRLARARPGLSPSAQSSHNSRRRNKMQQLAERTLSKVPEVTLGFWIIKILATTLGETGGDTVTMTLNLGYLAGTAIFATILVVAVAAQIRARRFHPFLYWVVIVATTTTGTTLADFLDRSLGIGYVGGSSILLTAVLAVLGLWRWSQGSVAVETVATPKVEAFYWATIMVSQTLGTALGDWMADTTGLGYERGALVFAAGLAVVAAAWYWTRLPRALLFWTAFILTRPLGATVGDFLDKPIEHGGLALSRPLASAVLAIVILVCIAILPQRAGYHVAERRSEGVT